MKSDARLLTLVAVGGLVMGCSTGSETTSMGMSGARHEVFASVEAMLAASGHVIEGVVTQQSIYTRVEHLPETISTALVTATHQPVALGDSLEDAGPPVEVGQAIEVRQLGTTAYDELPAPLLERDGEYLLFLVSSGLPSPRDDQFFVTGGPAGLFAPEPPPQGARVEDAERNYAQVIDSEDEFPPVLTVEELESWGSER